eukprot:364197-Chlamydomonas_euryale.AAC.20
MAQRRDEPARFRAGGIFRTPPSAAVPEHATGCAADVTLSCAARIAVPSQPLLPWMARRRGCHSGYAAPHGDIQA